MPPQNEIGFHRSIKRRAHEPDKSSVWWKIGTSTREGVPDCVYSREGVTAFVELKYRRSWPARDATVVQVGTTPAQRRHLDMQRVAGCPAWVLLGVGDDVLVLDPGIVEGTRLELCDGATFLGSLRTCDFLDALLLVP